MKLFLKHKNLIIIFIGILFGIFLYYYKPFHDFLGGLGEFGLISAFIAGILYDSTITVATGVSTILVLGETLPKWQVALVAGTGAVIGDFFMYKIIKNNVVKELVPTFEAIGDGIQNGIGKRKVRAIRHVLKTKYFHWTLPVVGAILIGSPFPNELAWGLMGAVKLKNYQVVLLSFAVNATGITLLLTASAALQS
jgi:hypothetical protein